MLEQDNPWTWMQPHDAEMMGAVIMDPSEQTRWCRALALGGLPFMWRKKARVVREMLYDRMRLRDGDRVLILGESIESCGFIDDFRSRIGGAGVIDVIDITAQARAAYVSGERGRNGQLATWRFDYTKDVENNHYDAVAVLQGVQHTDDWQETATELLRIAKPGRNVALGEITFSPQLMMKAELDLHIEYWLEKMMSRLGWDVRDFPYYSLEHLETVFTGLAKDVETFSWKGVDLLWATKPS